VTADIDVHSMGCGWTAEPYQTHPTLASISVAGETGNAEE
jgi:hypothetical protein